MGIFRLLHSVPKRGKGTQFFAVMVSIGAIALAAGLIAAPARADGDPASDYLLTQKEFLAPEVQFPAKQRAQFINLVAATNKSGFQIRVALIASNYDLGSVTALWRQPRLYARFLGEELSFLYKGRLLVVMPNGFGFNWRGHTSTAEYALLAKIPIGPGPGGELAAVYTAVQQLAAAGGVKRAATTRVDSSKQQSSRGFASIAAAILTGLCSALALRFLLLQQRRAALALNS